MTADFIRPADAFRMILRAIYPQNPDLPEQITSYDFFDRAQKKYKFHPASEYEAASYWGATAPPDDAWKPFQALHVLRVGIWQQKVALQGSRGPVPPAPINSADAAIGDLHVFAETLALDGYDYQRVWCSRADVLALVAEYVPSDVSRKLGSKSGSEYVATYIQEDSNPTLEGFRRRALKDKIKGARQFEPEYHRQMAARGVATTRGRRRKTETPAN